MEAERVRRISNMAYHDFLEREYSQMYERLPTEFGVSEEEIIMLSALHELPSDDSRFEHISIGFTLPIAAEERIATLSELLEPLSAREVGALVLWADGVNQLDTVIALSELPGFDIDSISKYRYVLRGAASNLRQSSRSDILESLQEARRSGQGLKLEVVELLGGVVVRRHRAAGRQSGLGRGRVYEAAEDYAGGAAIKDIVKKFELSSASTVSKALDRMVVRLQEVAPDERPTWYDELVRRRSSKTHGGHREYERPLRPLPSWYGVAAEAYIRGMSLTEIAAELGKTQSNIGKALDKIVERYRSYESSSRPRYYDSLAQLRATKVKQPGSKKTR